MKVIRHTLWLGTLVTAMAASLPAPAQTRYGTGVTATTIRIGQTMPYSGSASAYGTIGRAEAAYFQMVNEHGGVNGRKIELISLDDGYSPPKTVEQTRKLIERDEVLLIFSAFGTATISAVQKYLNDKKVPQLFLYSGASKWEHADELPWVRLWQPSYRTEGKILAKYLLQSRPDARSGILYQNDDYGRDYISGFKETLGSSADAMIVKERTYESADPTIDSQIVDLKYSGADVFFNVSTAKFAAQSIRRAYDIGWKPLHLLNSVSTSVSAVLKPAGLSKSAGIISAVYAKDPTDPQFVNDQAVHDWVGWMERYYPEGDPTNIVNVGAYSRAMTLVEVLRRCGDDLSRENILRQTDNLDLELPMLLPGIRLTSRAHSALINEFQLQRFTGERWERFGSLIELE
jgi:branched-chain amino acid transport system substrate-binding protein